VGGAGSRGRDHADYIAQEGNIRRPGYSLVKNQPTFSVIVPTFNRGSSLLETIDSVRAQSYGDFELIIVDDGSTDDTAAVVSSVPDPRLRYVRQANGGGSRARNTGIDTAQGRYIAFLDSDDKFQPSHLENALPVLESDEGVCTYTKVIVDRGEGLTFLKPHRELRKDEHIADYLMRDRGFVQTSTLIVPRPIAQAVRYDEQLSAGQDMDFAIRLIHAGAELRMLPEPGAIWNDRSSPARLSSKNNPEQRTAWLKRIQPLLTARAYRAELGWRIAKSHAQHGRRWKAACLYFTAVTRGCYRPKMAVTIFLQLFLSRGAYRMMADVLGRRGVGP
jgi:glycosyltransferase involved in cell wall biosynthesis